ncbi:ammonium transporter [Pontibacter sp. G13]|uniref:ammonium transporter n=1 Tax=Pontibacter sp. G13 TaxID=3074898 RepID=UPI0028892E84|nr:ammonium transporter [Pontibacter sp. G13]WNJ18418.1 ammonium transporter [Pontibacter sp. G13]
MNTGDTAWILVATAMVMLMTPAGLALFYGGLSNKKNVINTVGMSFVSFCTATIMWIVAGYSIAFSEGGNAVFGNLDHAFLAGIGINDLSGTIPELLFATFQGMFAAIAVAIISGSVVERIKFSTWIIFSSLWVLLVYAPLVRMIWGGGLLSDMGELDFAGGTVIHVNAGVAGLVLALLLGKRKFNQSHDPSSTKLTILGTALLWFGWFGFNAGSQLAADGVAANAFLVTNFAACAGGIVWLIMEWIDTNKPSTIGLASGVISGLVGITPAAGYVGPAGALAIGLSSGLIGFFAVVKLKKSLKIDDTLDAFGIHGLVGIWGSIATGFFADPAINGAAGLLYGNPEQVLPQIIAVLATIVFSIVGTFILYQLTCLITKGGRIDENSEIEGMDKSLHQETSFS